MYRLILSQIDPETGAAVEREHGHFDLKSDAQECGERLLRLYGPGGLYDEGWVRGFRVERVGLGAFREIFCPEPPF